MKPKKPGLNPKHIGEDCWWYEDEYGIDVYHHCAPGVINHVRISWRTLLAAAQRSSRKEVIVHG